MQFYREKKNSFHFRFVRIGDVESAGRGQHIIAIDCIL